MMVDDKAAREREMNLAAMRRPTGVEIGVTQISPEVMAALSALTPTQAAGLAAGTHVVVEAMPERIGLNEDGTLDEVVTSGGAHLEQMSARGWFLSMMRADGSEFCVWFEGKVTLTEERPAAALKEGEADG